MKTSVVAAAQTKKSHLSSLSYLLQRSSRQPVAGHVDDIIRARHDVEEALLIHETCVHGVIVTLKAEQRDVIDWNDYDELSMSVSLEVVFHFVIQTSERLQKQSPCNERVQQQRATLYHKLRSTADSAL